ncbi:MAG: hypothetical protein R3Y22_08375 [Bacteroidales bacterium]
MENKSDSNNGKRKFWNTNIFLYLVFVAISFLFWLLLTLNDVIHKDVSVNINVAGVPEEVTFINNIPEEVNVSVKEKGAALLRYAFGNTPTLDIKFADFADDDNFRISASVLQTLIRDEFGSSANILAFKPDSVNAMFTNMPGKVVPIKLNSIISTNYQYTQWDNVQIKPDSVTVYASGAVLATVNSIETELFAAEELKDSLYKSIKLTGLSNARISPREVEIMIPVEQLITKKQNVSIIASNVPDSVKLITFPSKVMATYLVPKSKYNLIDDIWADVDYNDIQRTKGNKIKINVSYVPDEYKQLSLMTDSVEFIIDKN